MTENEEHREDEGPPRTAEEPRPGPGRSTPFGAAGRLQRTRDDRLIAGVCGGLGRHLGVDPVVMRLAFIGLTVAGGVGVLLYIAAIVLMPSAPPIGSLAGAPFAGTQLDPTGTSPSAPRSRVNRTAVWLGVIAIGVATLPVTLPVAGVAAALFVPVVMVIAIGWLVEGAMGRRTEAAPDAPRIDLGRLIRWFAAGLGTCLVLGGLFVGTVWATGMGAGWVAAAALVLLGVALVVAGFRGGGGRWLVVPALAIAVPLAAMSAADVSFKGGVGERHVRPQTVAEVAASRMRIGIGELQVDLTDVRFPAGTVTPLHVGAGVGYIEIRVPDGVCLRSSGMRIGAGGGDVRLPSATHGPRDPSDMSWDDGGMGSDAGRRTWGGVGTERRLVGPVRGRATVDLDVDMDVGAVEVIAPDSAWCGGRLVAVDA